MNVYTDSPALWSSAYRPNKATARGCPLREQGTCFCRDSTAAGSRTHGSRAHEQPTPYQPVRGQKTRDCPKDGVQRQHSPPLGQTLKALCKVRGASDKDHKCHVSKAAESGLVVPRAGCGGWWGRGAANGRHFLWGDSSALSEVRVGMANSVNRLKPLICLIKTGDLYGI